MAVEMSEGATQGSSANNFQGNGALTILYPTPHGLLLDGIV